MLTLSLDNHEGVLCNIFMYFIRTKRTSLFCCRLRIGIRTREGSGELCGGFFALVKARVFTVYLKHRCQAVSTEFCIVELYNYQLY